MNIFWLIYLSGFGVALFYISYEYIKFCINRHIDYRASLSDIDTLTQIVIDSLGSWFTVAFLYIAHLMEGDD